ncbi:MAG: hypothetical protein B0D92_03640 [Spirochaeta sp. LUC14_002_19_P3]|nr:MAG: hypothetical protein B0D92_03640 [Spirochaeta sp. LUC14_002_19_P3]
MKLTARLLIFNILLVVFPIGAVLFLGIYEKQLLDTQERAMVQQGRILASALEGKHLANEAKMVLERLGARNDSRLRIVDADGRLLADSATTGKGGTEPISQELAAPEEGDETGAAVKYPELSVIYQIGAFPARVVRRTLGFLRPPQDSREEAEYYIGRQILDGPEIKAALSGRYGAATRISEGQVSVTLYSAIPIRRENHIAGAVLVSRSTFAILSDLYRLRLSIMVIFLFSVATAVILSLFLARSVTVPVGQLQKQAESFLDEQGKLQENFKPLEGKDEIAGLSRALFTLSSRLRERTHHLEDFMADLVHEMKNPVAGILSAAELASQSISPENKQFLDVIDSSARRIQHLLDDLRELISIDVRLDKGQQEPVDIDGLLKAFAETYRYRGEQVTVEYAAPLNQPVYVQADPNRLSQAITNLTDNAVSFSPPGGRVTLRLSAEHERLAITVSDEGPGIPENASEKIFFRWYTDRPIEEEANYTGLGLAIVQGIATGYGGKVYAQNAPEGGAVFTLEFPRKLI